MSQAGKELKGRILVVDDQTSVRITTAMLLRHAGYVVEEASDGEEALSLMSAQPVDLVMTDLKMEEMDGLTLLERTMEVAPLSQVIVMTAFGTIEGAVEAMRRGAYDYLSKPFIEKDLDRVAHAMGHRKLVTDAQQLDGRYRPRNGLSSLLGRSTVMQELTARITRVAPSNATVFIQGESGTGKELVARALHANSLRRNHPFVAINCASINESLLESELFGHAKGAFTGAVKDRRGLFEEADGGTLFIDEVTETSASFQTKLLRVLQEGEVRRVGENSALKINVRIVAASNRDVEREVNERRFRNLYYRLNVVTLHVPPLRQRLEDVPLLARHFLARANAHSEHPRRLSDAAVEHLSQYHFPGNVRELENLVEQAAALSENEVLLPEDFPVRPTIVRMPSMEYTLSKERTLAVAVDWVEKQLIRDSLQTHTGDLPTVAAELGISATTLWRKMKRHGLEAPENPFRK